MTVAVTTNFFALSSIGASVRTTPLAIGGASTGSSLTAVMADDNPGSLKMRRVAPPMFVPVISTVTVVPRSPPVGLTLSSVGGAVCAAAGSAARRSARVILPPKGGSHEICRGSHEDGLDMACSYRGTTNC